MKKFLKHIIFRKSWDIMDDETYTAILREEHEVLGYNHAASIYTLIKAGKLASAAHLLKWVKREWRDYYSTLDSLKNMMGIKRPHQWWLRRFGDE